MYSPVDCCKIKIKAPFNEFLERNSIKPIKIFIIYIFILLSFVPMFHYNVFEFYSSNNVRLFFVRNNNHLRPYTVTVELGRRFGMGTVWKMFSPAWKKTYEINLEAYNPEKEAYILTAMPNLTLRYRNQRSNMDRLFVDFKLAKSLSSLVHSETFRKSYSQYYCEELIKTFGWTPEKVRITVKFSDIPKPVEREDWNPLTATYSPPRISRVYGCLQKR